MSTRDLRFCGWLTLSSPHPIICSSLAGWMKQLHGLDLSHRPYGWHPRLTVVKSEDLSNCAFWLWFLICCFLPGSGYTLAFQMYFQLLILIYSCISHKTVVKYTAMSHLLKKKGRKQKVSRPQQPTHFYWKLKHVEKAVYLVWGMTSIFLSKVLLWKFWELWR